MVEGHWPQGSWVLGLGLILWIFKDFYKDERRGTIKIDGARVKLQEQWRIGSNILSQSCGTRIAAFKNFQQSTARWWTTAWNVQIDVKILQLSGYPSAQEKNNCPWKAIVQLCSALGLAFQILCPLLHTACGPPPKKRNPPPKKIHENLE